MQNWEELYLELATKLAGIKEVKWVDLWHEQVNFLDEEHPFPTPAVFLAFRTLEVQDARENIQVVRMQVEVYLYYETFADSYKGSVNQQDAMNFLKILSAIYSVLHSSSGEHYDNMRRIGMNPVVTGDAGNTYLTLFECLLTDTGAAKEWISAEIDEVVIENGAVEPEESTEEKAFIIPG